VRTLRFTTAFIVLVGVAVVVRYGVAHHGSGAHAELVNSFMRGFDALSNAFFSPFLGHDNPIPGRIGWLVIIGLLVFGYRELEVWAMRWQSPTVDLSVLGGDQQDPQNGSASDGQGGATADRRHATVANDLRFRLPAVAVRAPAILPGGTKVAGLVSIAESTGNAVGGLAGAVINFAGALWPNARQYQVRIRVEPPDDKHRAKGSVRVTVDIENSKTGASIATKTLVARHLDEAGCVVAGYVARQIFSADPTAPSWCYGSFDGSDLAAMLIAWQVRVYPWSSDDILRARSKQMEILERGASSILCAGVTRYELALLHDIGGYHVEALRLHAVNREQYPRFYRGRYRLGMSLEMVANPEFSICGKKARETIRDCLDILDRCGVTSPYKGREEDIEDIEVGKPLRRSLRMELLVAAQHELSAVRRQLAPWRLVWAGLVHRDERAIWKNYWRLAERERFHDGARVAELLVAVRQRLNVEEGAEPCSGRSAVARDGDPGTGRGQPQGDRHSKTNSYLRRVMNIYNLRRAEWITTAITGDSVTINAVLNSENNPEAADSMQPGRHAWRTRRVPWQRSTPSWQAAYNTACLYAALANKYDSKMMARRVVTSLVRATNDSHCEMGRPSDWIGTDPDFSSVRSLKPFKTFFDDLSEKDHQDVNPVPAHH
jgi:hypothetical protein